MVDVLSLDDITSALVEDSQHAHRLHRLWELIANQSQEELGPVDMLEFASGVEELLSEVHTVRLVEVRRILGHQRHSFLQDDF